MTARGPLPKPQPGECRDCGGQDGHHNDAVHAVIRRDLARQIEAAIAKAKRCPVCGGMDHTRCASTGYEGLG